MQQQIEYPEMVVFVRHGQSTGNLLTEEERAKRPLGTNFYQLTPLGREQARLTGEWLRANFPRPDKILRSFYERTRETADLLYPGLPMEDDYRLMEVNRGIWHVLNDFEIRLYNPGDIRLRERFGRYLYRPTGGESWPDAQERARSLRRTLRECHADKKLVVCVTHGHWILLFQSINEHLPFEEVVHRYEQKQLVENASVLIYKRVRRPNGSFKLVEDQYIIPWKDKLQVVPTILA